MHSQATLIIGLGNPGPEHLRNRHNAGAMALDHLAANMDGGVKLKLAGLALQAQVPYQGAPVWLAKPQTFMNESGRAVAALVRDTAVALDRILVIFDDLDLELGQLRMRPFGGSSGHNGMKSIIRALGSQAFPRLRIGIGRPPGRMDPAEYVLTDFRSGELEVVQVALAEAASCAMGMLRDGLEAAMTRCNSDPEAR